MSRRGVSAFASALAVCLGGLVLTPGTSAAADGPGTPGPYVALGDSYVAGPVIPVQTGTPPGCLRSTHNYPSLVDRSLGSPEFHDVSCSGATTANLTGPQKVAGGSNPAQLDALTPETRLVTLGIGGNDIGFVGIIETCAKRSSTKPLGSACKDYYTAGGHDQLAARIEATSSKVAHVLDEIDRRAPDAKVLVVGYPTLLPDSGRGCYPVVPFTAGDVAYLRGVEQRLNGMLAEQAREAGATFVDTYRTSIGHDVCTLPGTRWVEGLVPLAAAAPFHPNALGMRNSAATVLTALHTRLLAD
jgi:lysophospholipase L1-like esterase